MSHEASHFQSQALAAIHEEGPKLLALEPPAIYVQIAKVIESLCRHGHDVRYAQEMG